MDETVLDGTVSIDEMVPRTFVRPTRSASSVAPPHDAIVDAPAIKQVEDRFADRRRVFGINKLPEKKLKSFGSSCGSRTMTRC